MRYLSSRVLLFVIFTSMGVLCEGATLITATNRLLPGSPSVPIVFHFSNGGRRLAQTFTAEVSGRLLSVSMTVASVDRDPTGLQLAVTALENGQPGLILATSPLQGLYVNGRIPFSDIEVLNAVADFDDDQIILEAQQQYALLLVAVRIPSSFSVFGSQAIGPESTYTGGEILHSRRDEPFQTLPVDLLFEVTVETIPEPMTLTSALIFAAAALGRRRWRTPSSPRL